MDPVFSALLIINNFCHDIATSMLMASGVAMWVIIRRFENAANPGGMSLLFSLYRSISKIVTFSLIWIAAGAIPRILTFSTFEFANAFANNRLPGLIARYAVSITMTIAGAFLWISLIKKVKEIKGRALYIDV